MKLRNPGKNTLNVEVTQISPNGVWLIAADTEYFLSYEDYPWFENATVSQIHNVQLTQGFHLRWPDLDVDLELDSLVHPQQYPLKYVK